MGLAADARGRRRGDLAGPGAAPRHLLEHGEERVHHPGVELRAPAAVQLGQALGVAERGLVRTPARHGVVGVHHRHGARERRDVLAGEAVGVPAAVVALVVVADGQHEVLGEERPDDVGAHRRVLAHLVPLLLVQPSRLEQHSVGDADLADVVQVGGLLQRRQDVLRPAELPAQHHRVGRHARGVAEGVVVLGVERRAERLEVAEVHLLDLVVELGVLDRQGELRPDALQQMTVHAGEGVRVGSCPGRARRGGRCRRAGRSPSPPRRPRAPANPRAPAGRRAAAARVTACAAMRATTRRRSPRR